MGSQAGCGERHEGSGASQELLSQVCGTPAQPRNPEAILRKVSLNPKP